MLAWIAFFFRNSIALASFDAAECKAGKFLCLFHFKLLSADCLPFRQDNTKTAGAPLCHLACCFFFVCQPVSPSFFTSHFCILCHVIQKTGMQQLDSPASIQLVCLHILVRFLLLQPLNSIALYEHIQQLRSFLFIFFQSAHLLLLRLLFVPLAIFCVCIQHKRTMQRERRKNLLILDPYKSKTHVPKTSVLFLLFKGKFLELRSL